MIEHVFKGLASLRLTVVCLAFAGVLVFLGTIAQVEAGLYAAQARFFRSLLVYWSPQGGDWQVPVFPGGYLVGAVLVSNLTAAFGERVRRWRGRIGLLMTHAGLILLLLGQFATDQLSVESHMRLVQDEPKSYSESGSQTELAVIETTDPQADQVFSIPESVLAQRREIRLPALPFVVQVRQYFRNSGVYQREAQATNLPAPSASQGLGPRLVLRSEPPTPKLDERNRPAAIIELATPQGSLGTWAVALVLDQAQPVTVEGRSFTLRLRSTRFYRPYTLTLLQFAHEKYAGTEIPKNFASRIRLDDATAGENREMIIKMNRPLRYAGETFYQSGYDERDPRVSILQVVRNPSWLTPYLSCLLVGLGLTTHFLTHLAGFLKARRSA